MLAGGEMLIVDLPRPCSADIEPSYSAGYQRWTMTARVRLTDDLVDVGF
jgi:hypothetical protein